MELNKIHNTDCLEFMKTLPDKCIDLIVTSPPYNMGGKSLGYKPRSRVADKHYDNYSDDLIEKEYIDWTIEVIRESLRVSRYVFWNVQFVRSTRNSIFALQNEFRDNIKDIFIWSKQAQSTITGKKGGLAKGWEYIFLLGENNLSTFEYNDFPDNKYVPNIQTWFKNESFVEHAATFPQELPLYFIKHFTKENGIVFDPFMGVGTTGVASQKLKRNYIGCEISPEYCKIAEERIKSISNTLF